MTNRFTAGRSGGFPRTWVTLAILVLLGSLLIAPVASAAGPSGASSAVAAADQSPEVGALHAAGSVAPFGPVDPDNNTSNSSNGSVVSDSSPPSKAAQARVSAVSFDREYMSVRVDEPGERYNVSGPYVIFSTTEDVSAAKVQQPGADAKVLDGGRTVRVEFDEDAAPAETRSFYSVKLFFGDDSSRTLKMSVENTDQIVASAEMEEASELISTMRDDADEKGFDTDIDGLTAYYEWQKEQADLFNNLFGPQLKQLFAWLLLTIQTPSAIIFLSLIGMFVLYWLLDEFGDVVKNITNETDLYQRKLRELKQHYREQVVSANSENLRDVDAIGSHNILWEDAFSVHTTKQLADLFHQGRVQTDEQGNIVRDEDADPIGEIEKTGKPIHPPVMVHNGIDDLLSQEDLRDTWLEPILRGSAINNEVEVLDQARQVLLRMTTKFDQPEYRRTRNKVEDLIAERKEGAISNQSFDSDSSTGAFNSGVTGGAD